MIKKDRDICRLWDVVTADHPHKTSREQASLTCQFYNIEFRDDIKPHEVWSALEARENSK